MTNRIFTWKHAEENPTIHAAVCQAEILEFKDYSTGKVTVKGRVCTASDSYTTLAWPFLMDSEGYMTRAEVKQQRSVIRREMKAWLKAHSVVLTEPLRDS